MNELMFKAMIAMAAAGAGGLSTYAIKAIAMEGRLAAIEHATERNDRKLDYLIELSMRGNNDKNNANRP